MPRANVTQILKTFWIYSHLIIIQNCLIYDIEITQKPLFPKNRVTLIQSSFLLYFFWQPYQAVTFLHRHFLSTVAVPSFRFKK